MFVPLHDDNPLRLIRFQYVSLALIVINVLVFLVTGPLRGEEALLATAVGLGVVPSELFGETAAYPELDILAEPATLITYMFLHAGWLHLLSNMAFLWVFADNVEDAFGHIGFLMFYLVCGIAAALAHSIMLASSTNPLIGASGAMSGVLAAYLLLYPKARVWILLFMRLPLKIPSWIVLGGWFALQFVMLAAPSEEGQNVAWWAHIGGFCAGLILTMIFRNPMLVRRQPL
jgi:membrane associated rhomboid family serine protease